MTSRCSISLGLLLTCVVGLSHDRLHAAPLPNPDGAAGAKLDARVAAFLKAYCAECHQGKKPKGDFHLSSLRVSTSAEDAEYWQLTLDNLHLGEMPPKKAKQPKAAEREAVTQWIEAELRRAARALKGQTGEVVLRRLNRAEYVNTIADMFDVRGNFTDGFPEDNKEEGFDNNGAALALSAEQLKQYMAAADFIMGRAIQTRPRPETKKSVFSLHDYNKQAWERHRHRLQSRERDYDTLTPNEQKQHREEMAELKANPHAGYNFPIWQDGKLRHATPKDGPGVDAVIPFYASYAAPDTRHHFRARTAGWYRLKVTAYAVRNEDKPVRLRITYGSFRQGSIPKLADVVSLTNETPRTLTYRLYFQPNDIVKLTMLDGKHWARRQDFLELPGPFVAIRKIEMEGPLFDQWPPKGHRAFLGEREVNDLRDQDMPDVLRDLATRLFRRPVKDSVHREFVAFYNKTRQELSTLDAFKLTAMAMMTSPHFLYHVEVGEQPDGYALANRLSYFLWRSAPDATLLGLAASGKLTQGDELKKQVDRMLADPKAERFLNDFVDQWLGTHLVGEMQPDSNLYPEYDESLERSMVLETRSFIREMIQSDLPIDQLIDSDWAMLNQRMAKHYGIAGVQGNAFRKVKLNKSQTVRGGLLTQASILNITSNGTTTSPVVRGVWVLERLLGTPAPPPPPDVPAIEPDIRGASTIQQQMEKHRTIEQCASCHVKIDPFGMAMENFDVIGQWRDRYRALEPTRNPNRPKLVDGQAVIAGDTLPRHGKFDGFQAFRELLKKDRDRVARNVAHKLATFALGRSMTFADEQNIHAIVAATDRSKGGMKTMIQVLVASELFRRP